MCCATATADSAAAVLLSQCESNRAVAQRAKAGPRDPKGTRPAFANLSAKALATAEASAGKLGAAREGGFRNLALLC